MDILSAAQVHGITEEAPLSVSGKNQVQLCFLEDLTSRCRGGTILDLLWESFFGREAARVQDLHVIRFWVISSSHLLPN